MLHAVAKKKTQLYKRYLGHREINDNARVAEEDEITSTILGPMDFMSPDEILQFWKELLLISSNNIVLPDQPPENVKIELWPSRSDIDGKRIEPDAKIEFQWQDKFCILLIEIKWRAPLSGDNQLHKQWNNYLNPEERESAYHLFIAPEVNEGAFAKESEPERLVLIPWSLFRAALKKFIIKNNEITNGLCRWSVYVDCFLERIGINQFVGFDHLADELCFSPPLHSPFFWQPFQGFERIEMPNEIVSPQSPLFFNS